MKIYKILSLLGAFAAVIFAIAIPGIYCAISIQTAQKVLSIEAAVIARSIGNIVQARPDLWEFENVRLKELVSKPDIHGAAHEAEIRTAAGELVLKTDFRETRPTISASAPFFDSGRLAGSIILKHSIRTQIIAATLLGILGSLLGCLFYYIFRTYPIRKLEDTLTDLERGRAELEQRVADRTEVLLRVNEELQTAIALGKQSEDEIRLASEFLKNVIDSLPHLFMVIDAHDYTIKMANSAALSGSRETPRTCYALSHKSDKPCDGTEHACPLEQIRRTKKPVILEHRHYDKEGNPRNIEVHGYPIFDDQGNLIQIIEYNFDITERMQAEKALKASEEKHRTLFESSRDAIMTLAPPSWGFTSGNPVAIKMFNTGDEAAFTALGPWDVSPEFQPDGRPSSEKALEITQTAMAEGSHYFEWTHQPLGGKSFPCTVLLTRMEIGGQTLLQGTVRDITERKVVENSLRESEEKYRVILENANDAIWTFDLQGNFDFVNHQGEIITGFKLAELQGKSFLPMVHPDDLPTAMDVFEKVLAGTTQQVTVRFYNKNQQIIILSVNAAPIYQMDKISKIVCLGHDITVQEAMEDDLRKSREDFKAVHIQLVQSAKLASIGELASGVAHELNQPLMVIRGTAQLIERAARKGSIPSEALLTQLEPIDRNTKRMMRIIDHLRNFSRRSEMEFAPVEINHVIEECFLLIGEQLKLRDIVVERELAPDLPKIRGEANQLEQVFLNLIGNSRDAVTEAREKAAAEGREAKPGGITIISRLVQNAVEVLIRDTGGGIPADKISQIYDPFFTTKAVGKGTGLGLSISYGIIKDHGGEINVAETGPEGTTMRFLLPTM